MSLISGKHTLWDNLDFLYTQRAIILATPAYYFSRPSDGIALCRSMWPGGQLRLGDHIRAYFEDDAGGRAVQPCMECGNVAYCSWCGGFMGSPFGRFRCMTCGFTFEIAWCPHYNGTRKDISRLYRDLLGLLRTECDPDVTIMSYGAVLRALKAPVQNALLDCVEALGTAAPPQPTISLKKGGLQYPASLLLNGTKRVPQDQK
jgi:hypothetical protein